MLATAPAVSATTAVSLIPERSIEQRRVALLRANQIRIYRALVKRRIKAHEIDARVLLRDPHRDPITGHQTDRLLTMRVHDALLAAPKIGRVKADRMLRTAKVSPTKTLGGMTERQRGELLTLLGPARPRR